MATLKTCDKCKKEIAENPATLTIEDEKEGAKFDLCQNCFRELKAKWLEWMP